MAAVLRVRSRSACSFLGRRLISGFPQSVAETRYSEISRFAETSLSEEADGRKFLRLPRVFAQLWRYDSRREPLVYMRSCYTTILDLIWKHTAEAPEASVIGLGTPGIGKSGFVFAVLWHLLQRSQWKLLVLKCKASARFYIIQQNAGLMSISSTLDSNEARTEIEAAWGSEVWYLADWEIQVDHWDLECHFFVATSPGKTNHHQFSKGSNVKMLYIPTWSRQEIHELNDRVFKHPRAEVDERFNKWGGVPSHVLDQISFGQQQRLESALRSVIMAVQGSGMLYTPQVVAPGYPGFASDAVYHITVEDEASYDVASKKLGTPYIREQLAAGISIPMLDRALNYDVASALLETRNIYAEFFDQQFHQLLLHGCKLRSALMNHRGTFEAAEDDGTIGPLKLLLIDDDFDLTGMPSEELERTVLKPKSRSNTDWDFICGRMVFQLTVSERRKEKGLHPYGKRAAWTKAFENLRQLYRDGPLELVFAVPLANFATFKVTMHGGTSIAARQAIMNEYERKDIKVKVASCFLGGRAENLVSQIVS